MSQTSTTTTAKKGKTLHQAPSILLTPRKRKRSSERGDLNKPIQKHSEKELWEWTLSSAAVAKCYVRDAISMSESKEGFDFYWLGSVPCRKVEIIGVVVGVSEFEKKIVYTVDDGTAVIDCVHIQRQFTRPAETSKYAKPLPPPPPPEPITRVGGVVKVVGRVQRKFEYRIVSADAISMSTFGGQLDHWKGVRELHKTKYSRSGPFIIPATNNNQDTLRKSPVKVRFPQTPSTNVTAPQRAAATPSTVFSSPATIASSPIKPVPTQSPPKLRHPSRLHSHNLTDTAFLLYVKHFINNAPEDLIEVNDDDDDNDDSDIYLPARKYTSQILDTPTKPRRRGGSDRTPRAGDNTTPRPSSSSTATLTTTDNVYKGFTLSYLRRVPELSLMARRVVKYRAREEDRKAREVTTQPPQKHVKRVKLDKAASAKRKKRLFQWAICELLREGSVVLWDGPKRPCPAANTYGNPNASRLWKYNSSTASSDNTLFSNASNSNSTLGDEDELELSDPEPHEEAYASTKPELLASFVTSALKVLATAPTRTKLKRNELIGGSTKEEILSHLRRDDRWAFIGEWNVAATLEYMEQESLAWCVGQGKWLLTE